MFLHCFASMTESQQHIDELAPLLSQPLQTVETNKRVATLLSVSTQAGVVLFVVLVWSVLLTTPWSLFSYHPASMTVLVVAATEGMSVKPAGWTVIFYQPLCFISDLPIAAYLYCTGEKKRASTACYSSSSSIYQCHLGIFGDHSQQTYP